MQYRYKKSKDKPEKKPKNNINVVVEKSSSSQGEGSGEIRLRVTDESESKKLRRSAISSVIIFAAVALVCGFILYVNDYYHTDEYPEQIPQDVEFMELENGSFAFIPDNPIAGFVFYPDNKVEYTSYEQLMIDCAHEGFLCILVKMPMNLSSLDRDAADYCMKQFPSIKNWYIGGDSAGGTAAAAFASENTEKLRGLILLASYSKKDLSDSGLQVLSVYGSEDGVLNMKKYEKYFSYLPGDTEEYIIQGGCHSYFGNYGTHKGDGTPSISRSSQIDETVSEIKSFIIKNFE